MKVTDVTSSTDQKNITFVEIVMFIVLTILCLVAGYYGWIYGSRYAPYYLAILQSIGSTIQVYILSLIRYTQEYTRRSR